MQVGRSGSVIRVSRRSGRVVQTMKLRAQITVELESKDFVDAARHQQRFEEFFQNLRSEYGNAELQFREPPVPAAARGRRSAGRPAM